MNTTATAPKMDKKFFNDYAEARAFYEAQEGDRAIGPVRKELRAELGNWIVEFEAKEASALEFTGRKLVVRHNGKTATRGTTNNYQAAVVAENAAGELLILSCHWDKESAHDAAARAKAGKHVNQNYYKRATDPVVITA